MEGDGFIRKNAIQTAPGIVGMVLGAATLAASFFILGQYVGRCRWCSNFCADEVGLEQSDVDRLLEAYREQGHC